LRVLTAVCCFFGSGVRSGRGWVGKLYAAYPVFAEALDCGVCAHFDVELDRSASGMVMFSRRGAVLDQTAYTQPALFAWRWRCSGLLGSCGCGSGFCRPGHSLVTVAAAYVAGVFSACRTRCRLVAARGRLMQGLPASVGVMFADRCPGVRSGAALVVPVVLVDRPRSTARTRWWSLGWSTLSRCWPSTFRSGGLCG